MNIPQAVVLEATGDLKQAKDLEAGDPHLLLIKATLLLPPIVSAWIDADANYAEARRAFRIRVEEADAQTARGGYERTLRAVRDKLINGVTAKGSRAPHLPLEIIDPAEFARLELCVVDAVDPRTRNTVWYGILISARELRESGSQDLPPSELHRRRRQSDSSELADTAAQPGSPAKGLPPLSARDLRSWYEQRVSELMARGEAASGEADWEAARQQFPGRVTRVRVRELRERSAPVAWKKQGRRSVKAK